MRQFRLGRCSRREPAGHADAADGERGADWGGAAFDPETGLLYVRTSEGTTTNQICANTGDDPVVDVEYTNNCPHGAAAMMFGNRPAPRGWRAAGWVRSPSSAAVCAPGGGRPERRRDRLEGAVRRGQPGHAQPPAAAGRRAARSPGDVQQHRLAGDEGRPGVHRRGDPYLYAFDKTTGAEIWRGATPFRRARTR